MCACVPQCMSVYPYMNVRPSVNVNMGFGMRNYRCLLDNLLNAGRHTCYPKCYSYPIHHTILPVGRIHRNSDGNASFTKSYKGAETYVSPQRRHWPVYDTSTGEYQDASNYFDDNAPEDDRESMLELTKQESWELAPIRIFMELKRERGKLTQARASIRLFLPCGTI